MTLWRSPARAPIGMGVFGPAPCRRAGPASSSVGRSVQSIDLAQGRVSPAELATV
jgi:hypothetical protein